MHTASVIGPRGLETTVSKEETSKNGPKLSNRVLRKNEYHFFTSRHKLANNRVFLQKDSFDSIDWLHISWIHVTNANYAFIRGVIFHDCRWHLLHWDQVKVENNKPSFFTPDCSQKRDRSGLGRYSMQTESHRCAHARSTRLIAIYESYSFTFFIVHWRTRYTSLDRMKRSWIAKDYLFMCTNLRLRTWRNRYTLNLFPISGFYLMANVQRISFSRI